jgi:hypothetical protein
MMPTRPGLSFDQNTLEDVAKLEELRHYACNWNEKSKAENLLAVSDVTRLD